MQRRSALAAVLVAAFFLVAACGGSGSGAGAGTASGSGGSPTLKIGFVQALSGPGAAYAQTNSAAMKAAQAMAQQSGVTLDVVAGDDATDPATAAQVCQRMVQQDHVVAIIGYEQDAAASACNQATSGAKIPQLNATGVGGLGCIANVYGMAPTPTQSVGTVADYLVKEEGKKKIFFVGSDLPTNHSVLDELTSAVNAAGGQIVGSSFEPFGSTDFTNDLTRVKSSGADAVVSAVAGNDSLVFHKQYATDPTASAIEALEMYVPAVGSDSASYLNGLHLVAPYFASVDNDANTTFLADWKAAGQAGNPPTNAIEVLYSVQMLIQAYQAAGSSTGSDILAAMAGVSYDGPAGTWTEDNHSVKLPLYIGQDDKDGTATVIKTTDPLAPGTTCAG